MKLYII